MLPSQGAWVVDRRLVLACSVACAALCVGLAAYLLRPAPKVSLRMSAGPAGTRRYEIASYFVAEAAKQGVDIELTTDAGSDEGIAGLKSGRLDAALVCSGLASSGDEKVALLGGVLQEMVHLLVRPGLVQGRQMGEAIRGKRVNLGVRGSTEWLLARDFLGFARVRLPSATQPGDVIPTEFGKGRLLELADAVKAAQGEAKAALLAELPDCLIVLAAAPSSLVRGLVEAVGYEVVPLPAARAYLMDNIQDRRPGETVLMREFLERAVVPARCYFATKGYPETDCDTLGVRLILAARKDLPAPAAAALMKALFEGEFARRMRPQSPRDLASVYAMHPAANAYLDRDKPLAIAEAAQWISNGLSFLGAFTAGALSLYGFLGGKKARTPADYYAEIRALERMAAGPAGTAAPAGAATPAAAREILLQLDDRLSKLRQQLIEDVCEGRIKGDQVVSNILHLLADARQNIPKPHFAVERPLLSFRSVDREKAA